MKMKGGLEMTKHDEEHIYFNAIITDSESYGDATINKRYSSAFVPSGKDYRLCIDKFYINLTSVPLMIFDNTNNAYSVELYYNGVYSGRIAVTYVPTLTNINQSDEMYYYVYNVDLFIEMVNAALYTAFTTLGGLITLPAGSVAPQFVFDSATKLLHLYADANYLSSLAHPIEIYMNNGLTNYFQGFAMQIVGSLLPKQGSSNGRDVLFLVIDKLVNNTTVGGKEYYIMTTNSGVDTVVKWNVCKGIYFTSAMGGIKHEGFPSTGSNDVASSAIISNFDLVYGDSVQPLIAQYVLASPYKIVDMDSNNPIDLFDLSIYWYDKNNNAHLLKLYDGETATIRILFERK